MDLGHYAHRTDQCWNERFVDLGLRMMESFDWPASLVACLRPNKRRFASKVECIHYRIGLLAPT